MNQRNLLTRDIAGGSFASSKESRQDRRGRFHLELRVRDARSPAPIEARTYLGFAGYRTYAAPHRLLAANGTIYRVKERAQEGLGAEAIANRLAHRLGVGPDCQVIAITHAALPLDNRTDSLAGLQLGTAEIEGVLNDDELRAADFRTDNCRIDWESWATVVAFQTWIYAGDPQAVLCIDDGRIFSVDHGACFRALPPGPPTGLVGPELFGISGRQFDAVHLIEALAKIEAITEADLLALASGIPGDDPGWRMPIERRVRVLEWLASRQFGVRKVLECMPRLS
jgi:hypothetical protein